MFRSSTLFLAVPVIVVIILNISFLIQVIRILKSKLETEPPLTGSSLPITLKSAKAESELSSQDNPRYPYAIKNQRKARNAPKRGHFVPKPLEGGFGRLELVLYGIRDLA